MWMQLKKIDFKSLLWILLCIILVILLLKQLNFWPTLIGIFKAMIPLFFSLIFVFLFEPFINKIKLERFFSCTIVYFGFLAIVIGLLWFVVPVFIEQFQLIGKNLMRWFPQLPALLSTQMMSSLGLDAPQLMKQSYDMALSTTLNIVDGLSQASIAYIAAYFISMDMVYFVNQAKKHLPHYEQWARFYKTSSQVVFYYCIGISIDMLFLFISISVVLFLFSFPNAIFFGIVLALLNLIPYIGPFLGQILIGVVGLITYREFPWFLFLLIWLIQQVESNWIQPLIFNKFMDLRPILTLATLLVSGATLGWVGIVLSPIIAAIIQLGFRSYRFAKTSKTVGTWENIWYNFNDFKSDEEEE